MNPDHVPFRGGLAFKSYDLI